MRLEPAFAGAPRGGPRTKAPTPPRRPDPVGAEAAPARRPSRALVGSVVLHVAILAALVVGLPVLAPEPLKIEEAVPVSVIAENNISTAPRIAPTQVKPVEQPKPPPPKPPEPKPEAAAEQPLPAPRLADAMPIPKPLDAVKPLDMPPPPDLALAPVEEPKPKPPEPKPVQQPKPPEAKPQQAVAPPAPDKKPDVKKPDQPSQNFASLLKNLEKKPPTEESDEPSESKTPTPPRQAAKAQSLADRLTAADMDALRSQLAGCWSVPAGAREAAGLAVELRIVVNPDRTVREVSVVDTGRYNSDPFFRAAADSARRAVRNPACSPLALPPDRYKDWQSMTLVFDPKEMLG